MDEEVNPLERYHSLSVVLPGGLEKNATVHGSKPVMDLLVTLCASYHLNPSDYTVEVLSTNKNNISFKPNSPVGSLEAEKIVLKPKGVEEKIRRPYMPEASVRLLINYNKSHKAVVRVSPRVPLEMLLPMVCDKCEFRVETTILLRDSQSKEPLDLTMSLNEHGLREVFAKDTALMESIDPGHQAKTPKAAVTSREVISPPPLEELPKTEMKKKKNSGFLCLFRRGKKKKHEIEVEVSPPVSPGPDKQEGLSLNGRSASSSNSTLADIPKKRPAPQPPMGASQSVPHNLSTCHLRGQGSAESTLRSTKRRAPPPPCPNTHQELQADSEVKGKADPLNVVDELTESDESDYGNLSFHSSSSPLPSHLRSSSSRPSLTRASHQLHELADPYLPLFRGKDLSDARAALAKVLTSSVSRGALVKRMKNSSTFPKFSNGSSLMSMTQRCSDNGVFWSGHVATSSLPTDPKWEDPVERRGTTTFKVVPSKKQNPKNSEISLVVTGQTQEEENPECKVSPELDTNLTEAGEDPCSPAVSDTETSLLSHEPPSQEIQDCDRPPSLSPPLNSHNQVCAGSPLLSEVGEEKQLEEDEAGVTAEVIPAVESGCRDGETSTDDPITSEVPSGFIQSPSRRSVSTETDHCGSDADDGDVEEEVRQGEEEAEDDSFPPPPSPVFFNEDVEAFEEMTEAVEASSLTSSPPQSPASSGPSIACSEDHQTDSSSARPHQPAAAGKPLEKMSAAPSRFAEAVALAVQRSRLQRQGKGLGPQAPSGPHSALSSPSISLYQFGA